MPQLNPVPDNVHLHVVLVNQNGVTGHLEITAHVVETMDDGTEIIGPDETHGVDPLALKRMFGDDADAVAKWRETVKSVMHDRHRIRKEMRVGLEQWVGKRF